MYNKQHLTRDFEGNFALKKTIIFTGLLGFLLLALGCGSDKVGLSGKVTFSDDNSPLTVGTVYFATASYEASGEIKEDGTYKVSSVSENDGIPPGEYQVYILGAEKNLSPSTNTYAQMEPLIDKKFTSKGTSGLTVKIDKSTKTYDIEVDRPKK